MFDAGFWELLVIGVIALVVVGPERLPRLARTVGLWVGRARHAFYSVRDEIEREANAEGLRETEQSIRRSMRETESELRSEMESAGREGEDSIREAREATESSPADSPDGGADETPDDTRARTREDASDTRHG
ncbi:twin-arginine translocase subunit TatB [Ectothiorhodospiraceae bacterium WFHF3C12]|nr:twin-arginine translocase subunit TatB [Ectothiorhodospiraceae bacterium WFHF3C12]